MAEKPEAQRESQSAFNSSEVFVEKFVERVFDIFGGEIAAHVAQHCFWELDAPVVRVGAPSHPIPYQKELELATLPGPAEIASAVRTLVAR